MDKKTLSLSEVFDEITVKWFTDTIGMPTPVQEEAWPYIAAGENVLASAPTGTGKTLSAFLVFIDRLKALGREGNLKPELYLIYISPLKSLAGDIRENLKKPLDGISKLEENGAEIQVGIRTGDTTEKERRNMIKKPPHILITTPESLYLMLTSKSGKGILKTAQAVIIDELHALIDSKRGAHLMLSLARLDKLIGSHVQRIGLSATIRPLELAAEYLSLEGASIAAPKIFKNARIEVTSPLADNRIVLKDHVWQDIARTIYEKCLNARSVIAFCEGRMYSEKLAFYVNQLGGEGFARTHHGSLSKEQRFEVEHALRDGGLRLLCATSSMELGIDVGEIDMVFQIGCPRSISGTLQRLGRAGHNPGRTSVMQIFPRTASEGLFCGMTAAVALRGTAVDISEPKMTDAHDTAPSEMPDYYSSSGIEYSKPPRLCFDVLAQHLVSMAADGGYTLDDVLEITSRTYPFREVTMQDIKDILCMLAGDYEHDRDVPVRPRILYDRIHEQVEGDAYSRMLAVSTGGTIPDKGLYTVKNEGGVKLGELDEEFVYETRTGEVFLLGSFAWQIIRQEKDSVIVGPASVKGARMPYWKGEFKSRGMRTGTAFGRILRMLYKAHENDTLNEELGKLGLDYEAADKAGDFIRQQIAATGCLPDDKTILVEHFVDETGGAHMIVHSIFGRQINTPLALLACEAAKKKMMKPISCSDDEDGFVVYSYGGDPIPRRLLFDIDPKTAAGLIQTMLPATALFGMTFRYNASRALMMGVRKAGRQPLWIQRLRSTELLNSIIKIPNHPLFRETMRECLEDQWDVAGVEYVLNGIWSGEITVYEMEVNVPSPMSIPYKWQMEADMMYNYSPTTNHIQRTVEESLEQEQMIEPEKEQLEKVMERGRLPKDERQLHSLLMAEGDMTAGELLVPVEWLLKLAGDNRVEYIEPGIWIASEHREEYEKALTELEIEAGLHIVRRLLRYRGAMSVQEVEKRYCLSEEHAGRLLGLLCKNGDIVQNSSLYYHSYIYNRARQETIKQLRHEAVTLPAERYVSAIAGHSMGRLFGNLSGSPEEQIENAVIKLCGQAYLIDWWESLLLPQRVERYIASQLDSFLAKGEVFWRIEDGNKLSFHKYEEIDWEAGLADISDSLSGTEKLIYDALLKRGASFTQGLSSLLDGASPYEALMGLVRKGLVCADSFAPVRYLQNAEKLEKASIRHKVSGRVKASGGRWDLVRPLLPKKIEAVLEGLLKEKLLVCRETVQEISWNEALSVLRIWEYTGRVRRGYYIEGLSGAQFIDSDEYEKVMYVFEHPSDQIVWIPAPDPAQLYGKLFAHVKEREFMNIQGTAAALKSGVLIALFEKQGRLLRVFEKDAEVLEEAVKVFVQEYKARRIYPWISRLVVKEYPKEAAVILSRAKFIREMSDYVLYRS